MIYLAPAIFILDLATVYYGAKLIWKVQQLSVRQPRFWDVLARSIHLFLIRILWKFAYRFVSIDEDELQAYKKDQQVIKQVMVAFLLSTVVTIGFIVATANVINNFDAYLEGQQNGTLFLLFLMSALATGAMVFLYIDAKNAVQQYRRAFLNNFDSIGEEVRSNSSDAARSARIKGVTMACTRFG